MPPRQSPIVPTHSSAKPYGQLDEVIYDDVKTGPVFHVFRAYGVDQLRAVN